jgi:hypothetical protein
MTAAAVLLAAQVFTFVGHDCPPGYERLIQKPTPTTPTAKDIVIRGDGKEIELVWCVARPDGSIDTLSPKKKGPQ